MIRTARTLVIVGILSLSATSSQSFTVDDVIYDAMFVKCYIHEANEVATSEAEQMKARMELSLLNQELISLYGEKLVMQAYKYISLEFAGDNVRFAEACSQLE